MPWFKVDDNLAFHAKTVAAGNAALGLWVRAGSWSAQTLTEGFVPDHMIVAFGGTKNVKALLENELWDRVDGGYQFHDWCEYQPSRESVENDRKSAKERQQRARDKARQARDAAQSPRDEDEPSHEDHGLSHGVTQALVTVPPTRPDPTRPKEEIKDLSARRGRFDEFWSIYPKRGKHSNPKEPARQKWNDLVRTVDPERIIDSARVLAKVREGEDPQTTPQALTWLRQKRWQDDAPTEAPARHLQSVTSGPTRDAQIRYEEAQSVAPDAGSLPW